MPMCTCTCTHTRARTHTHAQTLLNHPVLGPALVIYTLEEEAGYTLVAENTQPMYIRV